MRPQFNSVGGIDDRPDIISVVIVAILVALGIAYAWARPWLSIREED
jgi:hypothetical protein